MEVRGTVVRIEGPLAWVRVDGQGQGCGRCDEPGGCRSARLTHVWHPPVSEFALDNEIGAGVGQTVRITLAEGAALRAALIGYGLPCLSLLAGAVLGTTQGDVPAMFGAGLGLLAGFALQRRLQAGRSREHRPRIAGLAEPGCRRMA